MIMPQALHILCFGDSLTAGFSFWEPKDHPYAISLESTLKAAFPTINVTTDMQGQGGDKVITPPGGFLTRMDVLYEEVHPKTPYTHAIILGGTNDLFVHSPSSEIYRGLKKVWAIPLSHGTNVLALTIPECPSCEPEQTPKRNKINKAILDRGLLHAEEKRLSQEWGLPELSEEKEGEFHTFDLFRIMPYESLSEEKKKELWSDGVHYSSKGYDLMGKLLAGRIIELVRAEMGVGEEVGAVEETVEEELAEVEEVETEEETPGRTELKRRGSQERREKRQGKEMRSGRVVAKEVDETWI